MLLLRKFLSSSWELTGAASIQLEAVTPYQKIQSAVETPGCSVLIKLFLISTLLTDLNLFQLQQLAKGTSEGGRKEPNGCADAVCI